MVVTMGGFEPPLDRLSTCCLCPIGLHGHGPSGWTRTTTSRVKSPACCVHTTKGDQRWSEWRDSNPHLKAWKACRQPLPHIRFGSAYGYRTRPPALATRDAFLHTQAERGPVSLTGPSTFVGCQRPRSCELGGRQGIRTQSLPCGRTGLRPVSGPSARTARLATAPGFEPGPTRFGGSDAPVTPRCRCRFTSRPLSETEPPRDLTRRFFRALGQNKKGLPGDRPRRPGSR